MDNENFGEAISMLQIFQLSLTKSYEMEAKLSRISWEEKYDEVENMNVFRDKLRNNQKDILEAYPELVEEYEKLNSESIEALMNYVRFQEDNIPPSKRIKMVMENEEGRFTLRVKKLCL